MAEATVTEYADLARDDAGNVVMVGMEPNIASQKVTYTTSTATTNALNSKTRFIRISTEGAQAHFAVAVSPTATDADPYIAAGAAEYFGVRQQIGALKVALYDGTS